MDVICTPLESETVVRVGDDQSRRRKRSSDAFEERSIRTKRGAVNYRMTEMNCTEVIGLPQPPLPPLVSYFGTMPTCRGGLVANLDL